MNGRHEGGERPRRRVVRHRRRASNEIEALPLVLTVDEVAEILRIGRGAVYELIHRHDAHNETNGLRAVRVGRKLRVPRQALLEFLRLAEDSKNEGQ